MTAPVIIPNVLTLRECADILESLKEARWIDGAETAGHAAATVKHNMQARDADTEAIRQQVVAKLYANPLFNAIARPRHIALMISRYQEGDYYGVHVDSAQVGRAHQAIRRDVSFTIGLSSPTRYQGGELVIETPFDEHKYVLEPGAMVVYPSTSLHRVEPVGDGERIVIVGWVRSFIRRADHRELLFELDSVRAALFERDGKSAEVDLLARCSSNLTREWMED